MNTEQIQEVIDILTKLLNEPKAEVRTTLSVTLTARELEVLVDICQTSFSVPNVVHNYRPATSAGEVVRVLDKLKSAAYSAN